MTDQPTYYPIYVSKKDDDLEIIENSNTPSSKEILSRYDIPTETTSDNFKYLTSVDYIEAYKSGKETPSSMAKKIIRNVEKMNATLNGISDWNKVG